MRYLAVCSTRTTLARVAGCTLCLTRTALARPAARAVAGAVIPVLWLAFGPPVFADVIDFNAQAAGAGGFLTGVPDSPLTIGIATFNGGELRLAEIGLPADQTGVYATEGLFGQDSNPLTIRFSTPVNGFSVLVANADSQNQSYTVSDDLGDTLTKQLALSGALTGSTGTFALSGSGIRTVTISSANGDFWNFAIDNVALTAAAVPEPATLALTTTALLFLACATRRLRG